jgi:iron(III) transport system substrate-binding protein
MLKSLFLIAAAALIGLPAYADEQVVNIYSARHYPSDDVLYTQFTRTTGIRVNRVDSDDAGIVTRLRSEGAASPADVILLVDAARLWRGEAEGLFQPVQSAALDAAIPAQFRGEANAAGLSSWFGFSTRARVIAFDKVKVKRSDVDSYEKLADPKLKGKLCTRSGSYPYNLSLFGAMLEHLGDAKTEAWLKGLVDNMARTPVGGDTEQIRAIASGECAVAIVNTYYFARLMRTNRAEDQLAVDRVGIVFPNQNSWGTHVNIAGGAVARYSKNPTNAIKFMEYLASPEAQQHFANGNNEWPVARGVKFDNPALKAMGGNSFKAETMPISTVGRNSVKVQQMLDRVGYQ